METEGNQEKHTRKPLPIWLKVLGMCVLVFFASIGYLRSFHQHAENVADIQDQPSDVPTKDTRKPAKDISFSTTIDGKGLTRLSEFKGKVVLVSFWASWCTPCLIELPTFIDLYEKLGSQGLVVLPINIDEVDAGQQMVPDFWKTRKFPFPTFYDVSRHASETFEVQTLPSNFVIDKEGRLVATGYGANDWSSETSLNFIKQLLKE